MSESFDDIHSFINALYDLKEYKYIDFEISKNEKGVRARFLEFKEPLVKIEKMKISKKKLMDEQQLIKEKGYSEILEKPSYLYKGKIVHLPLTATKIISTQTGKVVHFPLTRIVQIPLIILTKKKLTIAERLTGIELYRLRRDQSLNMKIIGSKAYMYLGDEHIKSKDLAEKIGFSKPILCNTIRKLWK